jgi:hypothetical protein
LKLLQENSVYYISKGHNFLNRTSSSQERGARIDKWDCIQLKSFHTAKETVTRMRLCSTEWERSFASYSSDKGLTARI